MDEHHATIEWKEAEHCYVLTDLNSAHGTYVNDCRIHNATVRLTAGDQLHFGYGGSTYELLLETSDAVRSELGGGTFRFIQYIYEN